MGTSYREWDGATVENTHAAARRGYAEAGPARPRDCLSLTGVHDCFSITELVTMEDINLADDGRVSFDILEGRFDHDGKAACQIDGGLKCFGHPVGASGLRMVYEIYLQLTGRAGKTAVRDGQFRLDPQPGGAPSNSVVAVSICGRLN